MERQLVLLTILINIDLAARFNQINGRLIDCPRNEKVEKDPNEILSNDRRSRNIYTVADSHGHNWCSLCVIRFESLTR